MVTVKRANVILQIQNDEVEKYYEKGYSVLDTYGNVIKASAPTEVGALQKALAEESAKVTKLMKEIEKLKAENENLLKMLTAPKEEKVSEEPVIVKRSYNRKKS